MDKTTRQVRQNDRVLEAVDVPSVLLTAQLSSTRPHEHWAISRLRLQGQGIDVALTDVDLYRTPSHIDLCSALQAHLAGAVSYGVTMGFLPATLEVKDAVDLVGTAGLRIPITGPIEPRHLSYAGDVRLQSLEIAGDRSESLAAHLNLAQGRLTVETARADLHDGEVRITSASFVDLQGPSHDFDVHVMANTLLEGIEIEATVQGNAFRKNAEGRSTSRSIPRFSAKKPL